MANDKDRHYPIGVIHDTSGNRIPDGVPSLTLHFDDQHAWGKVPPNPECDVYWHSIARNLYRHLSKSAPSGLLSALRDVLNGVKID